jgi:hypothetical protein
MTQTTTDSDGHAEADPTREGVERRLDELRRELRTGEERLRELDAERGRVRDTVLRIEGAILALEALCGPPDHG